MDAYARMPAVFIGHGSPMNTLWDNTYTRAWRAIGEALPRPRAILMVSAHWLTRGIGFHVSSKPKTIHDFGRFPPELFAYQYPAPGAPELLDEIQSALAPLEVVADDEWGLDHGAWSILAHLYPNADVPVAQLSMDVGLDAEGHFAIGEKLRPLRDRGVLIIGSGNIVHNLSMMRAPDGGPQYDWAERFDGAIVKALLARDSQSLTHFEAQGHDAQMAVPTAEHYWPLLYVAGAGYPDERSAICIEDPTPGAVSMTSWITGSIPTH